MQRAIKSAEGEVGGEHGVSIFQGLNVTIYVALLSALVYFINRDYGNAATIWLVQTFPREAETMGFRI